MQRIERTLLRWGDSMAPAMLGLGAAAFLGVFAGKWRWHGSWLWFIFCALAFTALVGHWSRAVRERCIPEAPLPRFFQRTLRETCPHLSSRDCELVEPGLCQFFLACLRHPKQFVAMPSQAVDVLWHAFILHTQAYQGWCQNALGFFLHHTPAEALGAQARHNDGLCRCWYWACKEESIDPTAPSRLPLLFALDATFAIPDRFACVPDSRGTGTALHRSAGGTGAGGGGTHCGTSFLDGGHSASAGDFGGADGASASGGTSDGTGENGGDDGGCGGERRLTRAAGATPHALFGCAFSRPVRASKAAAARVPCQSKSRTRRTAPRRQTYSRSP